MELPDAPRPRRSPVTIEQLGRTRTDDYGWMKDPNWREVMRDPSALDAEIRAHLEAENAYFAAAMTPLRGLADQIFAEMKGRVEPEAQSAPSPDGPWDYFSRYEGGAQHPRHIRRPRGGGEEQLLLDEAARAEGKAFFEVGHAAHSPDHRLYVWAEDEQGSEYFTLRMRDLETGELLPDGPANAAESFAISPDSQWLFWIWRDENARPAKLLRRPLRGGPDVLVHHETDEALFMGVGVASDDSCILLEMRNQDLSETWVIGLDDPAAPPRLVERRQAGVRYHIDHWGDRWIIRSNIDGAVDFALFSSTAAVPTRDSWTPLVPHRAGRLIAGFLLLRDYIVRAERENACDRIVVMDREGHEREIAFEEEVYALNLSPGYEYDTSVLRYVYQSPTTPRRWIDHDLKSGQRQTCKTQIVPSGHDAARYTVRRLWAIAPDGAQIPITALMLKDTPWDGSRPVLLYGYGAYGYPHTPSFSTQALSLVDRGWVWAAAHVRGGSDKGWGWFLEGRGQKKMNSFTDFVACAAHLASVRLGAPGRIVAQGGSAGGLLVGAAVNLKPELFGAVLAAVPFVDALNTMSDASLPLTPPEWPEWGNPITDPAAYDAIAAYSPYDNVGQKPYPIILARAGLCDTRVTWWEPEKWIARLRERTTSGRPVFLSVNMDAGHGGASGRWDHLKEAAEDYAFALWAIEGEAAA